ncbi:Hypothetical protein SRAE_1000342400 [Strongyloides ratti]|uniref:Uncharacterized protein n=1 Tax=Strongyloides ratti TaxID=34506 RepID=A0A090L5W6_STRRB|nr:Hypothetical protein SRAE_1000342400 [Strongyloides ratti]CEF65171.1 Hypothetical protein SRAE_1000342400 [Strongyloides ratti]
MFWGTEEENNINKILDKENLDLYEILGDPYCIEEIRISNSRLLEFFTRNDIMIAMLDEILFTTSDGSEDVSMDKQYFYAQKALNAFSAFSENVLSKYLDDENIAVSVAEYLLIEHEKKNSLTISFYVAILDTLFRNCLSTMIEFIKSTRLLEGLIRNIHYSSVVEFFNNIFGYVTVTSKNIELQAILDDQHITERLFVTFTKQKDALVYKNVGQVLISFAEQLHEVYRLSANVNDDILLKKIYEKSQWGKLLDILTNVNLSNIVVLHPICEMLTSLLDIFIDEKNPSQLYNYNSCKDQQDISGVYDIFEYDKLDDIIRNKDHVGEAYKYDVCRYISTYTGKLFLIMKTIREKEISSGDRICTGIMSLLAGTFNSSDPIVHVNGMNCLCDDDIVGAVFDFFHSLPSLSHIPFLQCAFKAFLRNILFYANEEGEPVLIDLLLNTFTLPDILLNEIEEVEKNEKTAHNMSLAFYISLLKIIYDGSNYSSRKSEIGNILVSRNIYSNIREVFKKYPQYIFQDFFNEYDSDYENSILQPRNNLVKPKRKLTHRFPNGESFVTTVER